MAIGVEKDRLCVHFCGYVQGVSTGGIQACRKENTAEPLQAVGFHLGALNTLWNQKLQDQQTKTEGV